MVELSSRFDQFFASCWLAKFIVTFDFADENLPREIMLEGLPRWSLGGLRRDLVRKFRVWSSTWGRASYWISPRFTSLAIRNASAVSFEMALPELFFVTGCWSEFQRNHLRDMSYKFEDVLVSELSLGLDHSFLYLSNKTKDAGGRLKGLPWGEITDVRDQRIQPIIARDVLSNYDPNELLDPECSERLWADASDYWAHNETVLLLQRDRHERCERTGVTYQNFQSVFENREWKEIAFREGLVTVFQPLLLAGKDLYKGKQDPYIDPYDFIEEWKPIFTRANSLNQPHDEHFQILTEVRQITQKFGAFAWGLDFRGSRYAAAIILAEAGRYEDAIRLMPSLEAVPDYYPEVTAGDDLVHRIAVECFLGMEEGVTALSKIVNDGRVEREGRLLYHRVDVSTLLECLIRCRNPEVSKILSPKFKEWNCEDEHRFFLEQGEITLGPWQPYRKN